MTKLITLISTLIPFLISAQDIVRADQIIIGKDCKISQMKTDADNNYFVTGYMHGKANFNPLGNDMEVKTNESRDIFIAKYSPENELLWVNQIKQQAKFANTWSFLDIDNQGNVIVGGSFEKGILIDNGQAMRIQTFGREDIYILKMNEDGKTLWWKHIGGLNMDIVSAIETDSKNNIYITGRFSGPVDFDPSRSEAIRTSTTKDVFLAKYSPNGDFKWVKQIRESEYKNENTSPTIHIDKNDQIYLAAQLNNNPTFLPSGDHFKFNSTEDKANIFVAQYSTNGNLYWVCPLHFDGQQAEAKVNAIHSNIAGNIYLTGYLERINYFNSDTIINGFTTSISQKGELVWNKSIDSPNHNYTNGICLNQDNEIVLAGSFEGFFDLENGQQMISQDKDAIIIKMDLNGRVKTALQISGEGSQGFESVAPRNDGKFLALGSFSLYSEINTAKELRAYENARHYNSPVAVIVE